MNASGPEAEEGKKSQATKLIELADELVDVVAGEDGRAYAVRKQGPAIAMPLRGQRGLRIQLANLYVARYDSVPSQSALTDATSVLEGRALERDPQPIHLRLARHTTESGEPAVVIDLGSADGACIIATPSGWERHTHSPVLFRRTGLTSPLREPGTPGSTNQGLNALRFLLNVDEPTLRLIVGWLVAGLIPDMPHPILAAKGEQGTGKSTALAMLINLIDPSPAPLRGLPKDQKAWATTAAASWAVCLDNVSTIPPWLSDVLCKAVTGDGFLDRALYSDDDVTVIAFRRLLAMTSIDTGALASDLTERLLPVEFQPIKKEGRRTDADIQTDYTHAQPAILAALLDLLCEVLRRLPGTHLDEMPRMADFARILAALDNATGWSTLDSYLEAAAATTSDLIDAKPFTAAIAAFVEQQGSWVGTMTHLLELITPPDPRPRSWPNDPTRGAGHLKRDAPILRAIGIRVEEAGRSQDRHRARLYRLTLEHPDETADSQCPLSVRTGNPQDTPVEQGKHASGNPESADTGADTNRSVSATVSKENRRSSTVADTADTADTNPQQLPKRTHPVESGTCSMCGDTFTRYQHTNHPECCTPCTHQQAPQPPFTSTRMP